MNTEKTRGGQQRRALRAISAVVVVALLGMVPVTASASDDTEGTDELVQTFSVDQCSNAFFCLWTGANYTGTFLQTAATSPVSTSATTRQSVWNRTSKAVRVYSSTGTSGASVCFTPGARSASTSIVSRTIVLQSGASC